MNHVVIIVPFYMRNPTCNLKENYDAWSEDVKKKFGKFSFDPRMFYSKMNNIHAVCGLPRKGKTAASILMAGLTRIFRMNACISSSVYSRTSGITKRGISRDF